MENMEVSRFHKFMARGRIMPYILPQRRDRATQFFKGLAKETAVLQKRDGGSGT